MNKNRKGLLIIIVILVLVYFILSIVKYTNSHKTNYKNTVIIGDFTKVEISNNEIKVYNDNTYLENKKLYFYFKGEEIEGYITSSNNGSTGGKYMYVAHKLDGTKLNFDSAIIGYTKDTKLKFKEVNNKRISDMTEVNNFLKSYNSIVSDNIRVERIIESTVDVEGDGVYENIYSVSMIEDGSDYDSFVFMKKGENYILISREISEVSTNSIRLKLLNIIDCNNDGEYEFVISKMMTEYGPNYYELYNYNGDSFTKIGGE